MRSPLTCIGRPILILRDGGSADSKVHSASGTEYQFMALFLRWLILAFLGLVLTGCQSQGSASVVSQDGSSAMATVQTASDQVGPDRIAASQYFIEFRSRTALSYGHSFVVFGRLDASGGMIDPEVAGLAPESDDPTVYMLGHVAPVPASTGWTDGDLEDEYITAKWRIVLSQREYTQAVANIRTLQAKSTLWHAALYNCNAFVGDIARSMGYRAPFHWLRPQQFITQLRKMNPGPPRIRQIRSTARLGSEPQ